MRNRFPHLNGTYRSVLASAPWNPRKQVIIDRPKKNGHNQAINTPVISSNELNSYLVGYLNSG
jgi:hypothetical protein